MVCAFFGHRDTPESIKEDLRRAILRAIKEGVDTFYVGNQGKFDYMVRNVLRDLKNVYPFVKYWVVLAYMPQKEEECEDTIYPEGIETVPVKFAIEYRNKWMIERANFVIAYVKHDFGGAAKFAKIAKKKGKQVINIAE